MENGVFIERYSEYYWQYWSVWSIYRWDLDGSDNVWYTYTTTRNQQEI